MMKDYPYLVPIVAVTLLLVFGVFVHTGTEEATLSAVASAAEETRLAQQGKEDSSEKKTETAAGQEKASLERKAGEGAATPPKENGMSIVTLQERIQRLEDREAIKELRAWYCYHVDRGDWAAWTRVFTEDADLHFPGEKPIVGHKDILAFAKGIPQNKPFIVHMVHNAIIQVEGDKATGLWYFEVPFVSVAGNAGWAQGIYNEQYRRVNGEWKISSMTVEVAYDADYTLGWADQVEKLK